MSGAAKEQLRPVGDRAARFALHCARETSARLRRIGGGRLSLADWQGGSVHGQLLVAKHDLNADPLLIEAVNNEARFLLGDYLIGGAA